MRIPLGPGRPNPGSSRCQQKRRIWHATCLLAVLLSSATHSAQEQSISIQSGIWTSPTHLVATVVNDGASARTYEIPAGSILQTGQQWQWYFLLQDVVLELEPGTSQEIDLHVVCAARELQRPPESAQYTLGPDPERRRAARRAVRTHAAWSALVEAAAFLSDSESAHEGILQWAVWAQAGATFGELSSVISHQVESKRNVGAVVATVGSDVLAVLENARAHSRWAWAEGLSRVQAEPLATKDMFYQIDLFWKFACFINLQIHDGQGDPTAVGEGPGETLDMEETRGAYTLANVNDTDGDGFLDFVDGNVGAGERDEIDLVQIGLNPPFPNFGGFVDLTINQDDTRIALWKDSTKAGGAEARRRFPVTELPLTLWMEGKKESNAVRDVELRLTYENNCEDVVRATFIWARNPDSAHDRSDNVVAKWPDFTNPPLNRINRYGGVGLQPLQATNAQSVIAIGTRLLPSGIGTEPDLEFDFTRQIHRTWFTRTGGADSAHREKNWPAGATVKAIEKANDDRHHGDESTAPSPSDGFYSMDAPGLPRQNSRITSPTQPGEFIYVANFYEYIRVGFGVRPAGNAVSGSRGSPKYAWHVRHRFLNDNGTWVRSTGDDETDENDIAFGHVTRP